MKIEGWGSGGGGMSPFTPTRELKKRKTYFKRAGHIMETLEREKMKECSENGAIVPFRPGYGGEASSTTLSLKAPPPGFPKV